MPELPEVESIRRGLARRVRGDVIESVWLGEKPEPLKSPAPEIVAALEQARIAAVRRVGKHIVFDLQSSKQSAINSQRRPKQVPRSARNDNSKRWNGNSQRQAQWVVHLGMTGSLVIAHPGSEVARHTHAIVRLQSGRELRFVDPRRFGRLSVVRGRGGFAPGGQEPLGAGVRQFARLFHGRKTPIKSALLNQKLLRGVGNIYADESLWGAKIHPTALVKNISSTKMKILFNELQYVLRLSIEKGGSTDKNYVDAEGKKGSYLSFARVFRREGLPCPRCGTSIVKTRVASRGTHFCPKCQKLTGAKQ